MKITREGGLIRMTFDRPQQRNLLTQDDCALIVETVGDAQGHAVLIDATGPVFCGGMEPGCHPGALFEESTWRRLPVVMAVQGPAMDEGVALIACAHVAVAAQGASFALTAMRRGTFPTACFAAVSRAIGTRRALELALTARAFTVGDALAWGLVHQQAPAFEFDDRAEAVAAALGERRLWLQDVLC